MQPLAMFSDLMKVALYSKIPYDTSMMVHEASELNEANEHSRQSLPPVLSIISTDMTPKVPR